MRSSTSDQVSTSPAGFRTIMRTVSSAVSAGFLFGNALTMFLSAWLNACEKSKGLLSSLFYFSDRIRSIELLDIPVC
jgi:hypothetical protein